MEDQITFEVTLDTEELEFEIKGNSSPTWTCFTTWTCEAVPSTFHLQIHQELLHAIRSLQDTFDNCLTSIWNRKQLILFTFGHDTQDDALLMATKFEEVKKTLLKFIQENNTSVSDIRLCCCEGSSERYKYTAAPIPAPRDPEADFELLEAIRAGNPAAVKRPLAAGRVNVNSRFWRGVTLVMLAAGYGHRNMVELLLGFRADMSLVDDDGDNILHFACWGGDVETVKLVLSHNIEIIRAMSKKTAVDLARLKGFQKVVELLMPHGAQ